MPIETTRDPRDTLVREKYFSLRPKPLERWLWTAKAPGSAERVFWYHWDLGHQNGAWISQVPIRIVAKECGVDVGTVTRAYQWLQGRGLLRRVDPGRDDRNPFRQATALTEVFVPRELVKRLAAEPNRRQREVGESAPRVRTPPVAAVAKDPVATPASTAEAPVARRESRLIFQKLSPAERQRFYVEQRDRGVRMVFDADTRLTETEQAHVAATLQSLAQAQPSATAPVATSGRVPSKPVARARLGVLQLAALRARIQRAKGETDARDVDALVREVAWSVEEGALARFEPAMALSIACKKIREQVWSTPHRMPGDWRVDRALPEPCSAAGGY